MYIFAIFILIPIPREILVILKAVNSPIEWLIMNARKIDNRSSNIVYHMM